MFHNCVLWLFVGIGWVHQCYAFAFEDPVLSTTPPPNQDIRCAVFQFSLTLDTGVFFFICFSFATHFSLLTSSSGIPRVCHWLIGYWFLTPCQYVRHFRSKLTIESQEETLKVTSRQMYETRPRDGVKRVRAFPSSWIPSGVKLGKTTATFQLW